MIEERLMTDGDAVSFAERVRAARQAMRLTTVELGSRLFPQQSSQTVSRWERGLRQPTGQVRESLAEVLGRPYHHFFPPEEVLDRMTLSQRTLLLTASHIRQGGSHRLYIMTRGPSERSQARALNQLWVVRHAGDDHWQLTGNGEETLYVLRQGR